MGRRKKELLTWEEMERRRKELERQKKERESHRCALFCDDVDVILCLVLVISFLFSVPAQAQLQPAIDNDLAVRAIIGEASNQGYIGMEAIASGIRNRGHLRGVLGTNAPHVDSEPTWVWKMAKKAWYASKTKRLHSGTHWENIKAFGKPYWAENMVEVARIWDHVFYKEADNE